MLPSTMSSGACRRHSRAGPWRAERAPACRHRSARCLADRDDLQPHVLAALQKTVQVGVVRHLAVNDRLWATGATAIPRNAELASSDIRPATRTS
jgi:hypothetical protein